MRSELPALQAALLLGTPACRAAFVRAEGIGPERLVLQRGGLKGMLSVRFAGERVRFRSVVAAEVISLRNLLKLLTGRLMLQRSGSLEL